MKFYSVGKLKKYKEEYIFLFSCIFCQMAFDIVSKVFNMGLCCKRRQFWTSLQILPLSKTIIKQDADFCFAHDLYTNENFHIKYTEKKFFHALIISVLSRFFSTTPFKLFKLWYCPLMQWTLKIIAHIFFSVYILKTI